MSSFCMKKSYLRVYVVMNNHRYTKPKKSCITFVISFFPHKELQ